MDRKPIIEPGTIQVLRQGYGSASRYYHLDKSADQYTDDALLAWAGAGYFGGSVDRFGQFITVKVYAS